MKPMRCAVMLIRGSSMQLLSWKIMFITFSSCDLNIPMLYVRVFYYIVSFYALSKMPKLLASSSFRNGTIHDYPAQRVSHYSTCILLFLVTFRFVVQNCFTYIFMIQSDYVSNDISALNTTVLLNKIIKIDLKKCPSN